MNNLEQKLALGCTRLCPLFVVALFAIGCSARPAHMPTVVSAIDLERYAGCWYEIASKPAPFQGDCQATSATYTKDGAELRVLNKCHAGAITGPIRQIEGVAWAPDPKDPAKLKVKFDRWWGIFARGDYWIVMLDPDYQYAVVTGPTGKYLWILSRGKMSDDVYSDITRKLEARGFDLSSLRRTPQDPERVPCGS